MESQRQWLWSKPGKLEKCVVKRAPTSLQAAQDGKKEGRKKGRKGALFYRVVSLGCKSHSSFSQTGANTCSYCGAHIIHTSAHACSPPGTPTTFNHKSHLWCESPMVCYFRGKEITPLPEAEGPLGESLVPSVINTSNAKPLREGGGQRKQATTVIEFIPNAQNITPGLNKGAAMKERVLSAANTGAAILRPGHGKSEHSLYQTDGVGGGSECLKGEVALWVMHVFFCSYTLCRSLYWFAIIREQLYLHIMVFLQICLLCIKILLW